MFSKLNSTMYIRYEYNQEQYDSFCCATEINIPKIHIKYQLLKHQLFTRCRWIKMKYRFINSSTNSVFLVKKKHTLKLLFLLQESQQALLQNCRKMLSVYYLELLKNNIFTTKNQNFNMFKLNRNHIKNWKNSNYTRRPEYTFTNQYGHTALVTGPKSEIWLPTLSHIWSAFPFSTAKICQNRVSEKAEAFQIALENTI